MRWNTMFGLVSLIILSLVAYQAKAAEIGWDAEKFTQKNGTALQVLKPPFKTANSTGVEFEIAKAYGSAFIGEPFWGHQADRRGNRLVLLISIGLACAVTSIAIITPSVGLFYAVFAVASFSRSGINIPGFNITMEFASPESLPTYVALRSSIIAPFRAVVPLTVGAIVGRVGYRSVFGGVAFLLLMGWVMMWRVREPRHEADKARKEELGRV